MDAEKMQDVDRYIQAATRANTRKAYRAAVRDFEVEWRGFLPATADSIARYLVDRATQQSLNTLKQRLAGLAQWHVDQGFPDPTKAPHVRKVLKGIRELHPAQEKRARPLQLEQLATLVQWLESQLSSAPADSPQQLRLLRDRALVLLGFWRGFRSDELCRLQLEHITITPGQGIRVVFAPQQGRSCCPGHDLPGTGTPASLSGRSVSAVAERLWSHSGSLVPKTGSLGTHRRARATYQQHLAVATGSFPEGRIIVARYLE